MYLTTPTMLKICHVNITSINKHKDELYARFHDFDIISINETNLKPSQQLTLSGFNIFRNDRKDKSGGGVLLAVKEKIQCHEKINKSEEENELMAVQIETKRGRLLIASIYIPPRAKLNKKLFEEIYNINNDCLILGDLNAALKEKGSRRTNLKGRQLQQILEEGYLQCVEAEITTFERINYQEKIYWVLATQPTFLHISRVETHPQIGTITGHKPMTMELSSEAEYKPGSSRNTRNYNTADWPTYRRQLNRLLGSWNNETDLRTPENIEVYRKFITGCMNKAAEAATSPVEHSLKRELPNEITKRLIGQKHQAYRQWKKSNLDAAKAHYYKLKVLVSNALRNQRIERFKKLMESLCAKQMNSSKIWKTVRKFHNKRTRQSFSNTIEHKNQTARTDQEKANLFAAYFEEEVFREEPNDRPFHQQVSERVRQIKTNLKQTNTKGPLITAKEIKDMILNLKTSSPGADKIHNRCLKNHTKSLLKHLTMLFNAVLEAGYIPPAWKAANIILILKPKKDKKLPSSYRPISLLSCLGKLLEKIIKKRLMAVLERRKILPEHQAGFRSGKSTTYNIVRLENFARSEVGKRRHAAVIFFDIKAAFDSVWFDGLIYKLNELRLPQYLIKYAISFLETRQAKIEIENTTSRTFQLRSGTPQGSPLSPLLYIIYTSDSMNGIERHTEHGLFADDTALWSSSNTIKNLTERLQASSDAFQCWCATWKLQIQPTKTAMVYFSPHPRKKYKNKLEIQVNKVNIKPQESARYLGVTFDRKLNWRSHIEKVEAKVASRTSLPRFISRSSPNANDNTMINIFKSLVRTVTMFGYPILLTADNSIWKRLQVAQNKAIRAALGLPNYTLVEYIYRISNLPKAKQYAEKLLERVICTGQS